MSTEVDLLEYQEELADLVPRIGGVVEDTYQEMDANIDNVIMGVIARHGESKYEIQGVQGNEHWTIRYSYEILTDFALEQTIKRAEDPTNAVITDGDIERGREEMKDVIEKYSPADLRVLRSSTIELLAKPPAHYYVKTNDSGAVVGFTSGISIFPMADSFDINTLHESVQTVITTALTAENHLQHSYGIHIEDDQPEPRPEADPARDPSFQ